MNPMNSSNFEINLHPKADVNKTEQVTVSLLYETQAIFDFVYVFICHIVCYKVEINHSEPWKNFTELLDNL